MRNVNLLPCLVLLSLMGCAHGSADVLLETDRAFAAECQAKGLQAAFTHYAAEDAVVLKAGGVLTGRDAVARTFAGTEQVELRWEPKGGELAQSGDVGFTWGTWTRRLKSEEPGVVKSGRYLTTWRRTVEGYRWTADLGEADPPPKAP